MSVPLPAIVDYFGGRVTKEKIAKLVEQLRDDEIATLIGDWSLWALPYQRLPPGDWRRWVFRGGRSAGKTYAGSSTTNAVVRDRSKIRSGEVGLISRTLDDARFTMVEGPSGILATAPPDFMPIWEPGNRLLIWPNGVRGRTFSADKPEQLHGPNWAWLWADEPAKWPDLKTTWWEDLEPALRKGWARAMLTSTPVRDPALKEIEDDPDTVVRTAPTFHNAFLHRKVIEAFHRQYDNTTIGRQVMLGEYLDFSQHALWNHDLINEHRVTHAPLPFRRVVIAVDPAVTAHEGSDETGIMVIGLGEDGHGYPIQDRSMKGSPLQWGRRVVAAYHRWQADLVVAEVNNGGDLVAANIHAIDDRVNVKSVRASRGKHARFEPVLALFEQGKVRHVGTLPELEDQMCTWEPGRSNGSPDRLDALAWGLWELFLDEKQVGPARAYL